MTTVLQAINDATRDSRVRAAMMLGALLEGGTLGAGPFEAGDSGTSFGPFQMHRGGALTSAGFTRAQAENPELAVMAMLGAYEAAVQQVPGSLWSSNPEAAAERAAYLAERPAQIYHQARGQGTVDRAWAQVQRVLKGGVAAELSAAGSTAKGVASSAAAAVTEPIAQAIEGFQASAGRFLTTAGFAVVGLGLVVLGSWRLFQPTIRRAQDRAAELGGQVAKGAL